MENLAGYIATGVVTFIVGLLLQRAKAKAAVVYWSPHSFLFNLVEENVTLRTDALTVQNLGRRTAEQVELILSDRPDFLQFSPNIQYDESETPDGCFVLTVASLGAKEFFTLQVLSYSQIPQLLNLRSKAGTANQLPFQIQRAYARWVQLLVVALLVIGIGFTTYWIIHAAIFLSRSIGVL